LWFDDNRGVGIVEIEMGVNGGHSPPCISLSPWPPPPRGEGEPSNWREQTLIKYIFERTSFEFSNSRAPLSPRERGWGRGRYKGRGKTSGEGTRGIDAPMRVGRIIQISLPTPIPL